MSHFDDAQWHRLVEDAAQELYQVYWGQLIPNGTHEWSKVSEDWKAAWRKVAEHVIQQSSELFGLLTTPDHR